MSKSKVTESVSESVTWSPIELFWTAKKKMEKKTFKNVKNVKKVNFLKLPNIVEIVNSLKYCQSVSKFHVPFNFLSYIPNLKASH